MESKIITGLRCRLVIAFAMLLSTLNVYSQDFKEQKIVISGRVLGYDKTRGQNTISFIRRSLVEQPERKISTIRPDGSFSFETQIAFAQDIVMQCGRFAHFFFRPGNNLKIVIKAPGIIKEGHNDFVTITGGSCAEENKHIQRFIQQRENRMDDGEHQKAVQEKLPEEYQLYVMQRLRKEQEMLKQFTRTGKTSLLFNHWAADYLQYNAWNDLLRYCWENPMLNSKETKDLAMPVGYFNFLSDYNMDDRTVLSAPHTDFLYELYRHTLQELDPHSKTLLAQLVAEKDITGMMKLYISTFNRQLTGFTRDVFMTRLFLDALNGNQLKEFKATWHRGSITNGYFRRMITDKSRYLENYLQNQQVKKGSDLLSIDHVIVKSLIDTLYKKYSGKVMYIDLWAPWCIPCMEAMPASKNIQELYKGKEIVFVFLANRCTDESWKATIANHRLPGLHINLTDDQYNVLAEKFNVSGIPHYVIIDKNGAIVNSNAPGPDREKELTGELNKLLQ